MREGKSRYSRRAVPLTPRVRAMLEGRRKEAQAERVFWELVARRNRTLVNDLYHQHVRVRRRLGLPQDFVVHSLRHTFCSRLGEAGTTPFDIMKLAGHYSVTVSERYVHPTPEAMERAIARLDAANRTALPEGPTGTKTGTGPMALPAVAR